ncbi:MAG: MFS transporter [Gemmatimonadetes bacterium]|nr:MFS transporter [Gemmatimonadota bacterium]MBT7864004.1 MFS transporter [Gemmatimonadota bacterium]
MTQLPTGTPSTGLPALSEHRILRFAAFTLLYAAQGLPYGLLSIAVPAYMAEQNLTPTQISSYMGIILLPWSLKLINGPIMDRWSFLAMGRRRPWVLWAQAGMVVTSLIMAFTPNPLQHLAVLTAMGFAVNFFTAFQDVAVDGMAVEIIPIDQQPRANGFMWGGKGLGVAAATAGGAWLMSAYGLGAALFAQALVIGFVMLIPLLAREHPGERLLPWTVGKASELTKSLQLEGWRDIGRSLLQVILMPVSLIAGLVFFAYNLIRGFIDALLPVLTVQEMGWGHTDFSELSASAGLVAGLLGMILGGWLVERLGRRRTIAAGVIILGGGAVAMAALAASWSDPLPARIFISAYYVVDTLVSISFLATMMAISWKRVAATQFSLYMAIANMGLSGGAALFGPLQSLLSYPNLFYLVAGWGLLVLAVIRFIDVEAHLKRMENL